MLPLELNRLLIIVVVLSMALTPLLNEIGRKAAESIESGNETDERTVVRSFISSRISYWSVTLAISRDLLPVKMVKPVTCVLDCLQMEMDGVRDLKCSEPVVILGFGQMGQVSDKHGLLSNQAGRQCGGKHWMLIAAIFGRRFWQTSCQLHWLQVMVEIRLAGPMLLSMWIPNA